MTAIDRLLVFLDDIEKSQFVPSMETIETLGMNLALAAKERQGYAGPVWQAGIYLLLLSIDHFDAGIDGFYQKYGYETVKNALLATFENGDFPLGLGFIVNDFLPSDGLQGLSTVECIRESLSKLKYEKFKVPIANFYSASPELRKASAQFLSHARSFGLPASSCLQIASALLMATFSDNRERESATRAFLDSLASDSRDINLFYCWRAAAEKFPELWNEPSYLNSLPTIIKWCRNLDSGAPGILAQLLSDQQILTLASNDFNFLILLGLAGWWLYVRNTQGEGLDIAWQLIFELRNTFPALSQALRSYLQNDQPRDKTPEQIERLQVTFQEVMQTFIQESRIHSYQGVPLALKIQRYNLVNTFEPLYEALESTSSLSKEVADVILSLNASQLIDENSLQKESRFPIEGKLRLQMINDQQTIINVLCQALKLREQLDQEVHTDEEKMIPLFTDTVKREIGELISQYPGLTWAIEWFLPETLSAN